MHCYRAMRSVFASTAIVCAVAGYSVLQPDAHLAAFSTQMTGLNEVPPVATMATGHVEAVLNKNDLLAGIWYVNIHTAAHPGGEIRGQMILRE